MDEKPSKVIINIFGGIVNGLIGKNTGQVDNFSPDTSLPKRNKTQQKLLLDVVKPRVEARLKSSLHNQVSILLDKEEDPTQINPPWVVDVKIGTRPKFRLPSSATITDIYDREDTNGRLLILGAPGAGKTTTLLQLAQVLINRACEDVEQPIPILLNISDWSDDKQSIKDWIVAELANTSKYGVSQKIAKEWLENQEIILLLDGLDELASERQEKFVERLNHFLQPGIWSNPLVICSRVEEYQLYETKLNLNSSIIIQPLSREQIQDFVLRTEGEKLWNSIQDDQNLMELSKSPFLLTIIVISYVEISFSIWHQFQSTEERLNYLFDAYIRKMFGRLYRRKHPKNEDTRLWLGWLANQLINGYGLNRTEFLIEDLKPIWLGSESNKKVWTYDFIYSLIKGLVYGLAGGLIYGLAGGLIYGLCETNKIYSRDSFIHWYVYTTLFLKKILSLSFYLNLVHNQFVWLIYGLIGGLVSSLIGGEFYGLIAGLVYGLIGNQTKELESTIKRMETLHNGLIGYGRFLISVLMEVFFYGWILSSTLSLIYHFLWLWNGASYKWILVLILALIGGLIYQSILERIAIIVMDYTIYGSKIDIKKYPNSRIKEYLKTTIILLAISLLYASALRLDNQKLIEDSNLNNFNSLIVLFFRCVFMGHGMVLIVLMSCLPAIEHLSTRLVMWLSGYIPWNYASFLDYCTDRLFLQRVGGGYRFIHKLLQEHFAQIWRERENVQKSN